MRKLGGKLSLFLVLFLLVTFSTLVFAANETNESTGNGGDEDKNGDKIEDGFQCLEEKAGDCSSLTTQELAFTILATPDNIFDDCVDELESRKNSNNWGNTRDTALAILAFNHAGKDTEASEEWLIDQEMAPTELIWYLEQDSNGQTECNLAYDSEDYKIKINENKKIDTDAGSCLTKSQSSFWLKVSPDCYGKEFTIQCDKDYITTLLYKNKNSQTIYVLEGTTSSPAFDSTNIKVNSKCFGESSCDYESTAWSAVALLKTGNNIEEYIPYLVALSDTNKRYLPESFIYMITNYEDYATKLIANQKLGNYWLAEGTAYNKFYDTSLALISLGGSSEQAKNSENWLLFSQGSNGCWQNSIRETAISLWALAGRSGKLGGGGGSIVYCTDAGNFCIPSKDCPEEEDIGDNYFCPALSKTCCTSENIKTCSEYGGEVCESSKVCSGNKKKATDTDECCVGTCEEKPEETACEAQYWTCSDSCLESQEVVELTCNAGQVCCKTKTKGEESKFWIWILLVLISAVLIAIMYVYREKLKLLWFKIRTKFKKDKGRKGGALRSGPRPPPRPGFPPMRRRPQVQERKFQHKDKEMGDTFKKLSEMSS